jgi:hypothetical protein
MENIMTDIINLKQQRKARARTGKEKQADANRRKFGRTKQEKQKEKMEAERRDKHLEGHKLEDNET